MEEDKKDFSVPSKKNSSLDQQKQNASRSIRSHISKSDYEVKSATEEVSEILTSLPETAKKYDNSRERKTWSLLPIKINENHQSSSPTESLSSSSEDDVRNTL